MPIYTIEGAEVEVPEGMSQEEATKIFQESQKASVEAAQPPGFDPALTATAPQPTPGPLTAAGASDLMRVGVPVAAAFVTKNPKALALITGLTELTASEARERIESPDYQSGMDFMARKAKNVAGAAASAGGSYIGDRYFLPWAAKGVNKLRNLVARPITKRVFGPKELSPEIATAQRFLGRQAPKDGRPFSLTWDQLYQGKKSMMDQLGSLARSGWVSGKTMRQSDILNVDVTNQFVDGLMETGAGRDPRFFGHALAMMLNRDKGFMKYQTNAFYNKFRQMAYDKGIEVDLSKAFGFLRENADNRFARGVASKVLRSDPSVIRSLKQGEEVMSWTEDQLEAYLQNLPASEVREFLDQIGSNVPLETAADMYHNLNLMFGKSKVGGVQHFTSKFKKHMNEAFGTALDAVPGSYATFNQANAWAAKHGARMEQTIIEEIFKKAGDKKPASIVSLFQRKGGIDNFKAVEKFFRTSDKLNMDNFDKTVRAPLRHRFLSLVFDKNTGRFSGASLDRAIKTSIKGNGPQYLDEIFGPGARVGLQEAANTLKVIEATRESNIVIKIIQAGVLMSGAGAVAYGDAVDSNTIQRIGLGAVAVGLLPWAAARVMVNPRLVRTLTDGMVAGPGTSKFARAIMVATVQNREALKEMAKLSPEAQEFYDNPYEDVEQDQAPKQAAPPTLGDLGGTAGAFFPDLPI